MGEESDHVRVSDEDRESVVETLTAAYVRGALEADEHEARITAAWNARDRGALVALTRDLPGPGRADAARLARDSDLREWLDEWRWWMGGALILSTIWGVEALRSGPEFYWPVVPLGVWAAVLVAIAIWPGSDRDR